MPLKKKIKSTRNMSEIFFVKKTSETLPSNKPPNVKVVLPYYLHLRKLTQNAKQKDLIRCQFKMNSFELQCPAENTHCCVMSKLVVPWNLTGFPLITMDNIIETF